MPYTYLVGWTKYDKWYYGVRFAAKCTPDDLWTRYFTSSKHVKAFRGEHGEPDVIQVRKTFATPAAAMTWETKTLRRLRAVDDDRWLNLTDNKAIRHPAGYNRNGYVPWNKGVKTGPVSAETIAKRKATQTGMQVWNNGVVAVRVKECPGEGWVLGRLDKSHNSHGAVMFRGVAYRSKESARIATGASINTVRKYATPLQVPEQGRAPAP